MVTTGARGCRLRRIVRRVEHALFDVGFGDAAHGVAEFLGDELRGVGVDRIGDLHHVALLHQDADHVDAAFGHAVGQFLNGDRFRDRDFARDLFLRLVAVSGHALNAAAERCDGALAHFVGRQCGHDGQTSAALFTANAGARRLRRRRRPYDSAAGAAAGSTRSLVLFGLLGRARRTELERRCRVAAEALLGHFVGLALGLFVVLAAIFFVALARFRGDAVDALRFFAGPANARIFLGALALFVLAQLRTGERLSAGVAFVVGQRAQHDAGGFRGGGGSGALGLRRRSIAAAARQRASARPRALRRLVRAWPHRGRHGV